MPTSVLMRSLVLWPMSDLSPSRYVTDPWWSPYGRRGLPGVVFPGRFGAGAPITYVTARALGAPADPVSASQLGAVELEPAGGELVAQAQKREVLGLRLQHHVEVEARRRLAHEVLERDRVDEVGVGAKLRQDPGALDAPADALLLLLHRRLRRG